MGGTASQGGDGIDDHLLSLLAEHSAAGRPCALATVVRTESPTSAHPGDKAVITADGVLAGWVGGSCSEPLVRREAILAMADGLPRLVRIVPNAEVAETRTDGELTVATTCPSGGALEIFIDPQVPRPLLVVVGGSPAARALVQMGAITGFRTCAVHPGATPQDFPRADLVLPSLERAALPDGPDSWVVVATMGHDDEDALEAVLALTHADIALVASARRAARVIANLRARGVAEAHLTRVRAPAGERRAGTQEEIALHALAEIVGRRRDRLAASRPQAHASITGFAVDPVCGMTVDLATLRHHGNHEGVDYHFCSEACAERFAAGPAPYLAAGRSG